jgi:prepilin-type N-terminal cleavage/methylation domain-containing protein
MFEITCNEWGFTLAELLIVLAILAIVAGIVLFNLAGITGGARSDAAGQELGIVQAAFDALMTETEAITISEYLAGGGVSVGPSTVITCHKEDGTIIAVPADGYYLRLRGASTGRYSWDSEGFVRQASY